MSSERQPIEPQAPGTILIEEKKKCMSKLDLVAWLARHQCDPDTTS